MDLPFTRAEFFAVFAQYNQAVWPIQIVLFALAVAAVGLALVREARGARAALVILGGLWIWTGAVYHGGFFRTINPAASLFVVLFVAQGLLLVWAAVTQTAPGSVRHGAGVIGAGLILYALVVYPALGYLLGHRYPANPTFGLPCPTTLFTMGLLLWIRPVSFRLFVIPITWAAIGASAAVQLDVKEDFGLPVGAVAAIIGVLLARRQAKRTGRAVLLSPPGGAVVH
jgi:hypothetical protein